MGRQLQLEIDSILAAPARAPLPPKSGAELDREIAERLATPDPEKVAAYEEKLEAKRDRLEAASAKHRGRAQASRAAARARGDMIPFGQPILVGHHSERRHRSDLEKIDRGMRKSFAEADRADELARAAARVGTAGISSDDPAAVVKLRAELAELERSQEIMKAGNALLRKLADKDDATILAALRGLGFTEAQARMGMRRDFSKKPNGFSTTNNGANMRRVAGRIEELTKKATAPMRLATHGKIGDITFEIREDRDLNRTQIRFSDKPDDATRERLRAAGFKWAPSVAAWQRHLSNGAWYHAHNALGLKAT